MNDPVVVARVSGLFGTRGWLRIHSYTRPRDNLIRYAPWYLEDADGWKAYAVREIRRHRGALIASLEGVEDRDAAAGLMRREIAVERSQLTPPAPGGYFWSDLIGLSVVNLAGEHLGRVAGLAETGANDVLRVSGERERLIPFVEDVYVLSVDLANAEIRVDWHAED